MENGGGQQQRERGRQQRLLGTRPYLRAQFDELTEMPISILSMGMGVCTHSITTSNSKEAFCMVYHTFLGKFQPTFSIIYRVRGMVLKNAARF